MLKDAIKLVIFIASTLLFIYLAFKMPRFVEVLAWTFGTLLALLILVIIFGYISDLYDRAKRENRPM
jgi:hypothetical protein